MLWFELPRFLIIIKKTYHTFLKFLKKIKLNLKDKQNLGDHAL